VRGIARSLAAGPEWWWVAALVAVSFAVRAWLASGMVAPFVMVDELIYSELAKSFAASGSFAVRDLPAHGYGFLYPLLISPAYALFDRVPDAYAAVKTIDSLTMSLAAVPAYLIARRVVGRWSALLGAALAVALPSLAYTGTVMTENLFYPLALLAFWVLLVTLEQPTWDRALGLLLVLGAAAATRIQAVVLVLAAATAPPLLLALRRGRRRRLRDFAPLYGMLAGAALVVVAAQVVRGRSPRDLLGAYAPVGEGGYHLGAVLRFWLWHAEELTLYVGVAPAVALVLLLARARRLPERVAAHLAVTVAATLWTTLVVAAFASRFADRIQERNLFFLAPLILVALLVWAESGAPRSAQVALPAAAAGVILVAAFPYDRFVGDPARPDTLALLPVWTLAHRLLFGSYRATVGAAALLAVVLLLLVPRRAAVVVPLAILAAYAAATQPVWSGPYGFERSAAGALSQGISGAPRDWIDAALPAGASAAVVWTGSRDRFTVNENEFFNRTVGRVYDTHGPTPGGIGETALAFDPRTGVARTPDGRRVRTPYALLDDSLEPVGRPVARDPPSSITLWRLGGPLVSLTRLHGVYPDGWSGTRVTYLRRRCPGGTVTVSLAGDTSLFSSATSVVAVVDGRERARVRFPQDRTATLRVPLVAHGGRCVVRFRVAPTVSPARVLAGSTDERVLGTHFRGFTWEPR
jgi:hypothetical protein